MSISELPFLTFDEIKYVEEIEKTGLFFYHKESNSVYLYGEAFVPRKKIQVGELVVNVEEDIFEYEKSDMSDIKEVSVPIGELFEVSYIRLDLDLFDKDNRLIGSFIEDEAKTRSLINLFCRVYDSHVSYGVWAKADYALFECESSDLLKIKHKEEYFKENRRF
jgi:hypothetical protein